MQPLCKINIAVLVSSLKTVSKHKKTSIYEKNVHEQNKPPATCFGKLDVFNVKNSKIQLIFLLANFYSFFWNEEGKNLTHSLPPSKKPPQHKPEESLILKTSDSPLSPVDAEDRWAFLPLLSFCNYKKKRNIFWVFFFGVQNLIHYTAEWVMILPFKN